MLLSSVEIRNAPWVLWISDLSVKDPYYILPIVMTLTTVLQTALNPLPPDPMQAKMMWLMPLVFSVMFFFFLCSVSLALIFLIVFIINVKKGQFEDDESPVVRILFDDEAKQNENQELNSEKKIK